MPQLLLQLKPSKSFFIMMLFMLGGASVSLFCSNLPYYVQFFLVAGMLAYGRRLVWEAVLLKSQTAVVLLACQDDNTWLLTERSGRKNVARLCGDSTRFPWFSVLRFEQAGLDQFLRKRRSTVVFYDSVDPVDYRRLQMRLGSSYASS